MSVREGLRTVFALASRAGLAPRAADALLVGGAARCCRAVRCRRSARWGGVVARWCCGAANQRLLPHRPCAAAVR